MEDKTLSPEEVLWMEFDVERHKRTFIAYLEVIIDSDGNIIYAIPSHQQLLIAMTGKTVQQLEEEIPLECMFDATAWLCKQVGCIAVWYDKYVGEPNDIQKETLGMLKRHGVYSGPIHI